MDGAVKDGKMSRRRFINVCLGVFAFGWLVTAVKIVFDYIIPPKTEMAGVEGAGVDAGNVNDIPVGKSKMITVKNMPVLVVRTSKDVVALSAVCTHLGCIVKWDEARQQVICPCHAAIFDVNGNVVGGPAPKPLPVYKAKIRNDKIYVI